MWTSGNCGRHDRDGRRYPADVTGAERQIMAPLIPRARRGGATRRGARARERRQLMSIPGPGCQWAALKARRRAAG